MCPVHRRESNGYHSEARARCYCARSRSQRGRPVSRGPRRKAVRSWPLHRPGLACLARANIVKISTTSNTISNTLPLTSLSRTALSSVQSLGSVRSARNARALFSEPLVTRLSPQKTEFIKEHSVS